VMSSGMEEISIQRPLFILLMNKIHGVSYRWPSDEAFLGNTGLKVHINNPASVIGVREINGDDTNI
jgi:hypothetical protein